MYFNFKTVLIFGKNMTPKAQVSFNTKNSGV